MEHPLDWRGEGPLISVLSWKACMSDGNAAWLCKQLAYVTTYGATYAPIQMRFFFFQGNPCIFQQDNDNDKPHTASIPAGWLHSRRAQVLDWPPCRPDQTFCWLKIFLNIFKQEIWQQPKCPNATMSIKGGQNYENLLVFLTVLLQKWSTTASGRRGESRVNGTINFSQPQTVFGSFLLQFKRLYIIYSFFSF